MIEHTELSNLFAAERAVRPPPEVAERGLLRLAEGLASSAVPPVAAASTKLGWLGLSKWVLGGVVLGASGSGMATAVFEAPSSPGRSATHVVTSPAATPRSSSVPSSRPAPALDPPLLSERAMVETKLAAPPRVTPPAVASSASASRARETFDAELRLIDAAKTELDRGRPHLAEVWLGEHAARYSTGVFSTEREALRVLVSCAERRDPARAARFVSAHPASPLSERLTRACGAQNSK
jgi:hypothetical protein